MVVPMGKPVDTKVVNPHGYTLNYNEFIVYDVKQIKMKYLVKVKFNFKWIVDSFQSGGLQPLNYNVLYTATSCSKTHTNGKKLLIQK